MSRGHDRLGEIAADRILAPPPERRLGLRVPVADRAVGLDRDEGVMSGLEDTAGLALAGRQRRLRSLALKELADLTRQGVEHLEQLCVRWPGVVVEELEDRACLRLTG